MGSSSSSSSQKVQLPDPKSKEEQKNNQNSNQANNQQQIVQILNEKQFGFNKVQLQQIDKIIAQSQSPNDSMNNSVNKEEQLQQYVDFIDTGIKSPKLNRINSGLLLNSLIKQSSQANSVISDQDDLSFIGQNNQMQLQQIIQLEDLVEEQQKIQKVSEEEIILQAKLDQNLSLSLKPLKQFVNVSSQEVQRLPCMLQITTQAQKVSQNMQNSRSNIDLICVVDNSGSMAGEKARMVRKSLKCLLKVLSDKDRLCIITFDTQSQILTPWLCNTEQNKQKFKDAIRSIVGKASTNTFAGMRDAVQMLQNRKTKNQVSCIFLLSDGQDTYYNTLESNLKKLISEQGQSNFTINTFGYGSDHDPNMMQMVAQMKEGQFQYVQELAKVSDYFLLILSGLLTVLAQNVKILMPLDIDEKNQNIVNKKEEIQISKVFGEGENGFWKKDWQDDKSRFQYSVHIPYLLFGDTKEYVFEIEIPKIQRKLQDYEKSKQVFKASLNGKLLKSENIISKEAILELQLLNEDEKVEQEENEQVMVQYLKQKGGDLMIAACQMAEEYKNDMAIQVLKDFENQVINCKFYLNNKKLQFLHNDIQKSIQLCQPKVFEQEGKAYLKNKGLKNVNLCQSICYSNDWNDYQGEIMKDFKEGKMNLSDCDSDNSVGIQKNKKESQGSVGHASQIDDDDQKSIEKEVDQNQKKLKRCNSFNSVEEALHKLNRKDSI